MNNNLFHSLFWNNANIEEAVCRFCRSQPEYLRAKEEFRQVTRELEELLGYEGYCRFEERLSRYWDAENRAYYLFGLGLRQDLLQALNAVSGPALGADRG